MLTLIQAIFLVFDTHFLEKKIVSVDVRYDSKMLVCSTLAEKND